MGMVSGHHRRDLDPARALRPRTWISLHNHPFDPSQERIDLGHLELADYPDCIGPAHDTRRDNDKGRCDDNDIPGGT
jgi:hypothetical protein